VAIVVLTLAILQVERMKERDVPQASHPLGLAIGLPSAPPSS
jgi:hypothetical protein